ncbi:MAG TPA: alpha/beta hydrolase [Xanthobacteraceae bacterium]|jgi:pimeloyl-ACP methyl ester carboxylesterase|nr:alpha/beta hydrolase [Xanthobacteraceae bacterium]
MAADDTPRSTFITAQDGLRLHVREYGPRTAPSLPVVCLPGLTRTTSDFDTLAPVLAGSRQPRRVIAIDSRGRGQSDYDPKPENYNVLVELNDVVTVLSALGIGPAVFVGSSRGGILTMLLGATQPALIVGVVLHDIGPVIEIKGVARIKSYVGKLQEPRSFAEGAEILSQLFGDQFPKLTAAHWLAAAENTWKMAGGELVPTYDVKLASTLGDVDSEKPLPSMWNEFDALKQVPVMVIRGANSDLLSVETVNEMRSRYPGLEVIEVPDQGHVPLFDSLTIPAIVAFVAHCDSVGPRAGVAHSAAN